MTIPLATTTVTVTSPGTGEPYETPSAGSTVVAGVAAHLSNPSGLERLAGGSQQIIEKRLLSEPIASLDSTMTVVDDDTGIAYAVVWVDQRKGLGLDHTVAGLTRVGVPV